MSGLWIDITRVNKEVQNQVIAAAEPSPCRRRGKGKGPAGNSLKAQGTPAWWRESLCSNSRAALDQAGTKNAYLTRMATGPEPTLALKTTVSLPLKPPCTAMPFPA